MLCNLPVNINLFWAYYDLSHDPPPSSGITRAKFLDFNSEYSYSVRGKLIRF
jgi:hypothetical protein